MKTIRVDFDPGNTLTLSLYEVGTDTSAYSLPLTESATDEGSYYYTGNLMTGRYRTALFSTFLVQRGRIFVGSLENTTYCVGNWDGEKDVT
jgi:hypothetical protein